MTAETVLANVLLEIGLDNTSAQLTSSDYEIRQIKAFMNAAGKDIARRAEWPRLYAELVVAGDISEVDLPDNFQKMAEKGAVRLNKSGFSPVRPIVAPEQWEFLSMRPSAQTFYHLSGGKVLFSPALDSDGALIRYVSQYWAEGKAEITQNSDDLLIPERLVEKGTVWRWKRQKGLPYDDILAEFEADLITEIKAARGAG